LNKSEGVLGPAPTCHPGTEVLVTDCVVIKFDLGRTVGPRMLWFPE
jgi:hypothetical protein